MHFEQFYLGCLAHASYMLASDGEKSLDVKPGYDSHSLCRIGGIPMTGHGEVQIDCNCGKGTQSNTASAVQ